MSDSERCARCGHLERDHVALNFADGPHVGAAVLVCPNGIFKPGYSYAEESAYDLNAVARQNRARAKRRTR